MTLATVDDFKKKWNTELSDDNIKRFLSEAENTIHYCTFNRIINSEVNDQKKELLKNAALYAAYHQIILTKTHSENPQNGITSVKLGDFSISQIAVDQTTKDANHNNKLIQLIGTQSYQYLSRSGFLYSGLKQRYYTKFINRIGDDDDD